LKGAKYATAVASPFSAAGRGQISKDGRSALVTVEIAGTAGDDDGKLVDRVDPIWAETAAAQRANPDVRIEQFGQASASKAFSKSVSDDFARAFKLSIPITLLILVVAFGALVAAGIPVLLAITGVIATVSLVAIPSQLHAIDPSISEVILLVGMAVGVDYSLFYLRRQRQERATGRTNADALDIAAATSGRSVLVSGITVMLAMAGMYFTGDQTFISFATGTIIVVAVAMLGSVTVLPALLAWLGDRVMQGRVPFIAKRRERPDEGRLWSALLTPVLRHPALAAGLATALLVALAIPALGLKTGQPGAEGLPKDLPISQTLNRMDKAFPGGELPAVVVIQADAIKSAQVTAGIEKLHRSAIANGRFNEPVKLHVAPNGRIATLSLPIAGTGTNDRSMHALHELRDRLIPQALSGTGAQVDVSGLTAESSDYNDLMKRTAPFVFAFVIVIAFGLLLVTFRSLVIPIKAIVLNLLSVGAAYGVLVLVFQEGWGESLLGFESTGTVVSWLPMFLFVILFGLSMDYHVFILSRVREAHDGGLSTDDSVAVGIKSTAGVVTSAALVMVAVFAIFGSLGALVFKQMGVGLAAAVLIDATIIRAVLLPASMKLLGDRNWYLPNRLEWLPTLRTEGADA